MDAKDLYLYKVYHKSWITPCYVAAENQQQAIDKVKDAYADDPCTLNIECVDMVTV